MELQLVRTHIDELDHELLAVISKRLELMDTVATFKFQNALEVRDAVREEAMIESRVRFFRELGFDDPLFVRDLFMLIMEKSRSLQVEKLKELEQGL